MFYRSIKAALLGLLLAGGAASGRCETGTNLSLGLTNFELSDQFGKQHSVSFPSTNVTVLTVADRKGSEQIEGWIAPLKARYLGRVAISGVADVGKVPGPLRPLVRRQFVKTCPYPVMLDWTGSVASAFRYQHDRANVFVIERSGKVAGHFAGATNGPALDALFAAVDKALENLP